MINVLFDSKAADTLNKLVQSRISSHLFLICNYNPGAFNVFGEDAKFVQGIANLYKFTNDASLIKRIKRIDSELGGVINYKYQSDMTGLAKDLDTIGYLRTYAFHNNDHNEVINKTEAWLLNTIHKKQFENLQDYMTALRKLEEIGDRVFNNVSKILENMNKEYSKDDLKDMFEAQIFQFYKENERIVREELRKAYKSLGSSRIKVNDAVIGDWCQRLYIGQYKDQIDNFSRYLSISKGEQKTKLCEKIEQLKLELEDNRRLVANQSERCSGRVEDLSIYDYLDYYCYGIGTKCKAILPELKKMKMTMLPQDMIQYIISRDFSTISVNS